MAVTKEPSETIKDMAKLTKEIKEVSAEIRELENSPKPNSSKT